MSIEKRQYNIQDMMEVDLSLAPSLDLAALRLERFFMPKDGGKLMLFLANVKEDWRPQSGCPYCHRQDTLTLSGRLKPRIIRDVVRNNYCVLIATQAPRMMCRECHQRFTPTIDGIVESRSMTQRLLDFVKVESFLQPHIVLAERTGLSIQTIQNIMDEEIERYEQMRLDNPIEAPEVLGIDEKHIQGVMRGTLVDVQNSNLLDMLENNEKETMVGAIKRLKHWDTNIRVVTTDMSNQYLTWLNTLLPNGTVVIDKYHVIQDIESKITITKNVLYQYRKRLIAEIEDTRERARQTEILRIVNDNKRLFNYSTESITRDKNGKRARKLSTVMDAFPEFRLLRRLFFYIEEMYAQESYEDAESLWNQWQELLPPSGTKSAYLAWCAAQNVDSQCFEAFRSLTRAGFTRYKQYILNYFKPGCRYTNAATEGLNNLIGSINISGNGYRFKHLRAKALYASLIHKRITYSVNIKSIPAWTPTKIGFQSYMSERQGAHVASQYTYANPFSFSASLERRKFLFRRKTTNTETFGKNVLMQNEMFQSLIDGKNSSDSWVCELIDGDDTIQSIWSTFQPNDQVRAIEQLLADE